MFCKSCITKKFFFVIYLLNYGAIVKDRKLENCFRNKGRKFNFKLEKNTLKEI